MWGITGKNRNTLNSNEYDVFMSYNSKDKKLIKKIAKKLKEGGDFILAGQLGATPWNTGDVCRRIGGHGKEQVQ